MGLKDPVKRRAYINARAKEIREGRHIVRKGKTPRKGEDITCTCCGQLFYRSPANRLDRGENQYCSRKCMAEFYKGRFVGEKHPRWRGQQTKPCDHCAKSITRPSWTWAQRNLTFCNMTCFATWKSNHWNGEDNPSWKGGHPYYYGPNWVRQAYEARKRDNHRCQFCNVSDDNLRRSLDVHHIRPFRFFGLANYKQANRLVNLVSLCEHCHTFLEKFSEHGNITDWTVLRSLGQHRRELRRIAAFVQSLALRHA